MEASNRPSLTVAHSNASLQEAIVRLLHIGKEAESTLPHSLHGLGFYFAMSNPDLQRLMLQTADELARPVLPVQSGASRVLSPPQLVSERLRYARQHFDTVPQSFQALVNDVNQLFMSHQNLQALKDAVAQYRTSNNVVNQLFIKSNQDLQALQAEVSRYRTSNNVQVLQAAVSGFPGDSNLTKADLAM